MKSLLRYPGGKSRAINTLFNELPKDLNKIVSPFFGGGSFEFFSHSQGIEIIANDAFEPLTKFWNCLYKNQNQKISEILNQNKVINNEIFNTLKKDISEEIDDIKKAAYFYILNRSSFSGSTCSGGLSKGHPRFNDSSIKRLQEFKMPFMVQNLDFKDFLNNSEGFVFADPPYMIKNFLYGKNGDLHKGFDHQGLAGILLERGDFILTYNDCEQVRELYKSCHILPLSWKYGMNKTKESSEILIKSK